MPITTDIDRECFSKSDITRLIDAFLEPAYLVSPAGNVIFANQAAREVYAAPPHWISAVAKSPDSRSLGQLCVSYEMKLAETSLHLILPLRGQKQEHTDLQQSKLLQSLPPSLSQVAQLLMLGMSDKEIARCSELTVASVRTYTSRIYRRLEIRGRQELLALALAEKHDRQQKK